MPCLGLKIAVGTQTVSLGLTAVLAVEGTPTVVISAGALAAMAVQLSSLFATMVLLAGCLDAHDRHEDAESLRRELDALKREVEALPH